MSVIYEHFTRDPDRPRIIFEGAEPRFRPPDPFRRAWFASLVFPTEQKRRTRRIESLPKPPTP